ncbi:TIGR03087 family PEP-CTERM/XrtA system glycosyltransferase [Sphingomonas sp. HHU CXW]|uniref:TIGR03087 family PEP-CTERM/XrtA system glycosyltransferase n=1 Tax=Sphingomonas hominis TaxID=2741495 RepID=A0ABX2JF51_9SPHN|nr:TIGR03087 family PEP-CTERM/XrtA system glycosyltransferase [Sphingomonas hominis]NTS64051.1 TIGR03087 family PEP-CTERM/XrtA system glycosyltransferase [Sphingomonas hominis]
MDILFLAHRVPSPPDRGDKIRSFHVLRHLAARARVHLVAFADDPRDLTPPPEFREMLGECVVVERTKPRWRAGVEALASGRPLSLAAFDDARVHAAVARIVREQGIDRVYAFSGQMAQYLPAGVPAVMDFVDADSAKFAAFAEDAGGASRWMYRREARLLGAYERAVTRHVEASLFVSVEEAALVPGARALENGIDTGVFDPAAAFVPVIGQGRLIVFTGQMDYKPNVDAVVAFVREVLPRVREAHPEVRFAIVGRAPVREVRALASAAVIVTGEVPDVRGWLAAADVVVAPLGLARGIQNKVLEAMAMARPVVASPAAAEGIDHAEMIRVAAGAGMGEAVTRLLDDAEEARLLGQAARARVRARYAWDACLAPLDAMMGLDAPALAAA